ncbi:MAG: hypothetical protein ACFFAH_04855 [Promethearchaeota archaeon]
MFGITWILLVSPYWPDAITFIMVLSIGEILKDEIYFFLANALIAPIYITWSIAFSDLVLKERSKKKFITIMAFLAIIFEVIFLSLLITDLSLIGTRMGPFYVKWTDFVVFYLLFSIAIFLITGILFVRKSLRSENKEIKLKGKFLMIAFLTFAIGTIIDALGIVTELTLVLARTFVIIGAVNFYIGFTLPKLVKDLFLKEEQVLISFL